MEDKKLKVLEIFGSIDGEGRRAGELTTFIRLSGCNLRCSWCDTSYSQNGQLGEFMSIADIVKKVQEINYVNITVTGGEPLIHQNITELLQALVSLGFDVNVETNGSIDPLPFMSIKGDGDLWFTIDYKSTSSGMQSRMREENFINLRDKDVIKFVVGSKQELEDALKFLHTIEKEFIALEQPPLVYFSPVFGMIEPVEIVDFMKENRLTMRCRVQLQLHKIIWDPNTKCV